MLNSDRWVTGSCQSAVYNAEVIKRPIWIKLSTHLLAGLARWDGERCEVNKESKKTSSGETFEVVQRKKMGKVKCNCLNNTPITEFSIIPAPRALMSTTQSLTQY